MMTCRFQEHRQKTTAGIKQHTLNLLKSFSALIKGQRPLEMGSQTSEWMFRIIDTATFSNGYNPPRMLGQYDGGLL